MSNPKKSAAVQAALLAANGMVVGLGTGSTATFAIEELGRRVAEGLQIRAVASSEASAQLAQQLGITIVPFSSISSIDLTIDGADEVDAGYNLVKGGGGALLREKILAYNSRRFVVVVDESKLVAQLGKFPLPVELVPFAYELTLRQLEGLGCTASIRQKDGKPFITDNGNLVADCLFGQIPEPTVLNTAIQLVPGVVECGLFAPEKVSEVFVGYTDGRVARLPVHG